MTPRAQPGPVPIRIGYVIDTFDVGGTELNAIRTLEALDRNRFEVTVFHLHDVGPLRARYDALGVPMIHLPITGFRSLHTLRQALSFAMLLRRLRIQVVHCHDVYTNVFAAPWARVIGRCGVIASRRWFFEVPRPALNPLNRWSYKFAHRVLANSNSVAKLLETQEHVPISKIVQIPNFLGDNAFDSRPAEQRLKQRRNWGIPDGAFVVGVVARLAPVKNHAMLILAADAMHDDVHIVFIGDGPERLRLQSQVTTCGLEARVHFVGELVLTDNIHQYFDVSVLCSRSEGFPNSVIEAMAARRAVVATRVGGVVDVIAEGETGLLVESDDVPALVSSLCRLQSDRDLCSRLGIEGQRRVRNKFSRQIVVQQLQNLYEQLAMGNT